MKKAILKTSGTLLVVGLALTAMLFGCKHKTEPTSKAETQTGKVTITILGDSNVKSIETEIFTVDKGSKWSDIKGDVKVTYKDDYEAAGFKLGFPNGMNLTDNYVFNINITVVAVSKAKGTQQIEKVTITVAGDANVKSIETESFTVDKGSKWSDIKGDVKVTYNEGYEAAGFKLGFPNGMNLTDNYVFNINITVVAVSKAKGTQQIEKVTITVAGDANVTVNAPASFEVAKGSKLGDIKSNVNVTYKEGYEAAGFKLENASGQDLTDDYAFNESKTVFAVSKLRSLKVTVIGDERTDTSWHDHTVKIDYDKTWQQIKSDVEKKVPLKYEWQGGDYAIYEWRLDGETGEKLTDDYKVKTDITVYAVTNYAKFYIQNNKIILTSEGRGYIGGSPKGKIIIPENITEIENYTWSSGNVKGAFIGCSSLTSVSFPASLTSIGKYAFYGCTGLTSVSFPASLTSIDQNAFSGCTGLTNVNLSSCTNLTSIGERAFQNCIGLTSVDLSSCTSLTSMGEGAFNGCSGLTSVDLSSCTSLTSIGVAAFRDCKGLTSVSFPASLTSIGFSAFSGCSGLTNVSFPASLTSIGRWAFSGCSSLTNLSFPASLTEIGYGAFSGCSSLTNLSFPASLTSIGGSAFEWCTGLTSVSFPASLTEIGRSAFEWCTGLTSVSFPTSLTSIGDYAFRGCSSLTSVSFPASLTEIGLSAFSGCKGLTSVNFPASLTSIGEDAFRGCSSLTNVSFPASLTSIGESAFSGCTSLTSVDLSSCTSLTSIGFRAFRDCTGLTSVSFPASLTSIGGNAFLGCTGLMSVSFPASLTSIGESAFRSCRGLASVTVDVGNSTYKAVDNVVYTKDGTTLVFAAGGLTSVNILPSVTSIGSCAFYECTGITSVSFPASLTSIGGCAFERCTGLTSVSLSSCTSLTSIGGNAFYRCTGITSVSFPASLTSIGNRAFSGCDNLTSAIFADAVGWAVYNDWKHKNRDSYIQQSDLANPATAAKYLRERRDNGGYCDNWWKKN